MKKEYGYPKMCIRDREKIMEVLDVTPNELLSGEWKYINQSEKEICQFLRAEERLNAELKHGHYDNFFDSEEEWLDYELEKLREYIADYINGKGCLHLVHLIPQCFLQEGKALLMAVGLVGLLLIAQLQIPVNGDVYKRQA